MNPSGRPELATQILDALDRVLAGRRDQDPEASYVASLHHKGLDKILEKVGEEAIETLIAAKNAANVGTDPLVRETADLWFHSLVMLSHLGLSHRDVLEELARRFGVSGHEEKAARDPGRGPQPTAT